MDKQIFTFDEHENEVVPLWMTDPNGYWDKLRLDASNSLDELGYSLGSTVDQRRAYINDCWREHNSWMRTSCSGTTEEFYHDIPDELWDEYVRDYIRTSDQEFIHSLPDAYCTCRSFPGDGRDAEIGELYYSEWASETDTIRVTWQFPVIKGQEPEEADAYDWCNPDYWTVTVL